MAYNDNEDSFTFNFLWKGKLSQVVQDDIKRRIIEVLFPIHEYLFEESVPRKALTSFKYVRYPTRLNIIYKKHTFEIDDKRMIKLNENLCWDIDMQTHANITGSTGSGKTMFLYYLILETGKITNEIYIVDAKGG